MFTTLTPAPSSRSTRSHADREPDQKLNMRRTDPFMTLVRAHHQTVFHLVHALLRDEALSESVTRQVFARARRRFGCDDTSDAQRCVEWIYQAALRFVRMYHWRSVGLVARRRMNMPPPVASRALSTRAIVRAITHSLGKIAPRDCELLALRHVLGMSLAAIAQLLRMHPYEISNRLALTQERVARLDQNEHASHHLDRLAA